MKRLLILLTVIAAAFTGSFYWVGTEIETRLPELLQRASQVGQFKIELTSYDRKLFRSSAVTTITLPGEAREQVILQHSIWHGPLPIGQSGYGKWFFSPAAAVIETTVSDKTARQGAIGEVLTLLPGFAKLHDLTVVSLTGAATSEIAIPPFQQQVSVEGNTLNFDWGGLIGSRQFTADLTSMEGEATIAGIKIDGQPAEGGLTNLAATVSLHEDKSGLLLGNVTLDIATIDFGKGNAPAAISIKGFQLRNAASVENDLASYAIEIAADAVQSPEIDLMPAGFEVVFSKLDADTILGVQRRLQTLQTDLVDLSENDISQQVMETYLEALPALIRKSPEINLTYLRARTGKGEIWAKGKVVLSDEENTFGGNPDDLSRLVQAEGEAQISVTLLQALALKPLQASMEAARKAGQFGEISDQELNEMIDNSVQQQLDLLLTQGMLTLDGDKYRTNFSYRDQVATLNGNRL